MKSTISKYYKDKGSIGIYNDSDELCHIDLGDGKFKEVKTIEESIAKHLRLGNDFRSPARKGFIQEDNINKEGFLISSRPSVLLPVLNDRGLNLIGRMQTRIRDEIAEVEFKSTLNSTRHIKGSIDFLNLEKLYSTYFNPIKNNAITLHPTIFGIEIKELNFAVPVSGSLSLLSSGLMARIGNISIYASRKIDPNTILFHCNTDRIKVSEPTVKIKLDTERFSLNVEEYFKPSENSIAIQFFDLPETWDVDNLAEYYRKIRK